MQMACFFAVHLQPNQAYIIVNMAKLDDYLCFFEQQHNPVRRFSREIYLSHEVALGSDITPCIKMYKPRHRHGNQFICFCGSFWLLKFHVCLCYASLSVPCSLVLICWESRPLGSLVCYVFCHFPLWCSL